jgi:hypothetical protein
LMTCSIMFRLRSRYWIQYGISALPYNPNMKSCLVDVWF